MAPVVVRQTFVDTPRISVEMDVNTTVSFVVFKPVDPELTKDVKAMRKLSADHIPPKANKSAL